jgi:hypothetical protein
MNVSGVKVSFYWAEFSTEYLQTVRLGNLSDLKNTPRITLRHSQPRSLLHPKERDCFLGEFVSIVRCVAEGYGKVGYLRRDKDTPIHRDPNNAGEEDTYSEVSNELDSDSEDEDDPFETD